MIRALAAALALALAACSGEAEPPVEVEKVSPALWELRGAKGNRGWLFGTIHALPEGTEWDTPALGTALREAGVLVVEIADLGDRAAARRAFASVAESPGLPPLLNRVPPPDRPALAAALERAGLDESDFSRTETWAVALTLANALRSGDTGEGVDRALLSRGLPVVALESFAGQFALFDRLAEADQAELLRQAAREGTSQAERERVRAWLEGDLEAIEAMAAEALADPELREALVGARNRAWAARIGELVREGRRPLVAVGAGHMIGPEGLPALLAAQGLRVTRIQ